jgi:hypothetical protein
MQFPSYEHFREIVIPAWQAYLGAEERLTVAIASKDAGNIERARYDALREGGAATFYLHHYAEIVARASPDWLPAGVEKPGQIWAWVESLCTMLRGDSQVADVSLLGDVADALKHAVLTRHLEAREVASNDKVLVVASGYGELAYGEGKFGGTEQVLVLAKSGARALSSILQNVVDAWRRAAGLHLPDLGQP